MPNYPHSRKHSRNADGRRPFDKGVPMPETPTRITIPASSEYEQQDDEFERMPMYPSSLNSRVHTLSQEVGDTSLEESSVPPVEDRSLDDLWETLRQKKELKMAKERPKVQSLQEPEEFSAIDAPDGDVAVDPPRPEQLRRQKSITSFRESADGRTVAAFIDMQGVQKQDVHVSYQRNRLVVSWESVEVSEYEEDGYIIRERLEKNFQRSLPLPEGTRFDEVSGVMNGRHLVLRYPNSRSFRVENRPSSVLS